eukprot:2876185-Ditylum_brightwellii.AAC.1
MAVIEAAETVVATVVVVEATEAASDRDSCSGRDSLGLVGLVETVILVVIAAKITVEVVVEEAAMVAAATVVTAW